MIIPVPDVVPPAESLGRVHFVGIGGAALSGLARLMRARGIAVSGSDAQHSATLESLRALGIRCYVGHAAEQLGDADTVVVSTAVPANNPEVARAIAERRRVWPRAAAVQSLLVGRRAIVVTGTHGKTTTTAMVVTVMRAAGTDPSYALGSPLQQTGLNAAAGADPLFVVEGDESDAAILAYRPFGAVVTNVDADHLDFFGSREAYATVFDDFLTRIEADGFLVCGVDDAGGRALAERAAAGGLRTVPVGQSSAARLRAVEVSVDEQGSTSEAVLGGTPLGRLRLKVPGRVYVTDAIAAVGAGLELGYDFATIAAGLADFRGTGRRMEFKGEQAGIRVYDSYAHHPVEIAGDLEAGRALAHGARLVVCFQPHLFSRTQEFAEAMGQALGAADVVVVLDVYAARERPVPGVSGVLVADAVPESVAEVAYVPERTQAAARVVESARRGDLVLTLGAGDVTDVGPEVLNLLAALEKEET